jgi:hypothetical protein
MCPAERRHPRTRDQPEGKGWTGGKPANQRQSAGLRSRIVTRTLPADSGPPSASPDRVRRAGSAIIRRAFTGLSHADQLALHGDRLFSGARRSIYPEDGFCHASTDAMIGTVALDCGLKTAFRLGTTDAVGGCAPLKVRAVGLRGDPIVRPAVAEVAMAGRTLGRCHWWPALPATAAARRGWRRSPRCP